MKSNYVVVAYLVFVAVLAWDYLAPRLRLERVRRAVALRLRREAGRQP
jgi:heme exporter protein D